MKMIKPVSISGAGSFTRSTTATYFDYAGQLKTSAIDQYRYSYDPSNLALPPQLITEGTAANQAFYSEQFDNSAWTKTASLTVSPNDTMSPADFGVIPAQTLADKIALNSTANTGHAINRLCSIASNVASTFSIYVLPNQVSCLRLVIADGANSANYVRADIDAVNLTATATNFGTGSWTAISVNSCGNGWVRATISGIPNAASVSATSNVRIVAIPSIGASEGYAGAIGDCFWAWGAQYELGSVATSYFPATSVAGVRATDVSTLKTYSNITEPSGAEALWSPASAYSVGTRVIRTSTHKIYECAIAVSTGTNPAPETLLTGTLPTWIEVSSTNKWALFDDFWSTQTTSAVSSDFISMAFQPGVGINSIAFLNLTNVHFIQVIVSGTAYSSVINTTGKTDYVFTDLTSNPLGIIFVTLYGTVGATKCGKVVIGNVVSLGDTAYGSSVGITDYSTVTTDPFGVTSVVKRKYVKRMTAKLLLKNTLIDGIYNALAAYRSTPAVWIGSDNDYSSLIVFGYYKDFDINIAYASESDCSLIINGLS
jgi:hypothetical protein